MHFVTFIRQASLLGKSRSISSFINDPIVNKIKFSGAYIFTNHDLVILTLWQKIAMFFLTLIKLTVTLTQVGLFSR